MARKLLAALVLAGGWAAAVALFRRAGTRRKDRVDLYFEDGGMASVADGSADAARLLPLAAQALRTARGS